MWGQLAAIDLSGCDISKLKDKKLLSDFLLSLCKHIGMVPHGSPMVERFGHGDLEGNTGMLFIETSSITCHLDEVGGRAFIDVFSCKSFDPESAKRFCADFYGSSDSTVRVLERK